MCAARPSLLPLPQWDVVAGVVTAGAAVIELTSGCDASADRPHRQIVYSLITFTLQQSVRRQARGTPERSPAALAEPVIVARSAASFTRHFLASRGAPGLVSRVFANAMQPLPGLLADAARQCGPSELV